MTLSSNQLKVPENVPNDAQYIEEIRCCLIVSVQVVCGNATAEVAKNFIPLLIDRYIDVPSGKETATILKLTKIMFMTRSSV